MFDLSFLDVLAVALPTLAALAAYVLSGHIARRSLRPDDNSIPPAE